LKLIRLADLLEEAQTGQMRLLWLASLDNYQR